jgi:hypothetical protein
VPFMCLPVSRLFWVSSLAYPNLLGTKGYVVVVVLLSRLKQSVIDTWEAQFTLRTYCIDIVILLYDIRHQREQTSSWLLELSGWGWQCPITSDYVCLLVVFFFYFFILCFFWYAGYGISKSLVGDLSLFRKVGFCPSMPHFCLFLFNVVFNLSQISNWQREQTIYWHLEFSSWGWSSP